MGTGRRETGFPVLFWMGKPQLVKSYLGERSEEQGVQKNCRYEVFLYTIRLNWLNWWVEMLDVKNICEVPKMLWFYLGLQLWSYEFLLCLVCYNDDHHLIQMFSVFILWGDGRAGDIARE